MYERVTCGLLAQAMTVAVGLHLWHPRGLQQVVPFTVAPQSPTAWLTGDVCALPGQQQNELRLQSSLTDASLAWLAPLKHLRSLSLRSCVMVEGAGLRHITSLTMLRSLDLTGCVRLTNKGEKDVKLSHTVSRFMKSMHTRVVGGCCVTGCRIFVTTGLMPCSTWWG